MPATTSSTPTVPARDRVLEAATRLFYADGVRAVSADTLIAEAGVSKVTFYRHFPSKDALVVAYLQAQDRLVRDQVAALREQHPDDPAAVLRGYAEQAGSVACLAGFRGCPFVNAAVEFPDPDHPVRRAVAVHRDWLRGEAEALLADLGVQDPPAVATTLLMLRDGAMVAAVLAGPSEDVGAGLLRVAGEVVRGATRS